MKCLASVLAILMVIISWSCGFPRKVALDPESESFYEKARLIMTGEEKDIFNHLPDRQSRREFIQDFWAKRDPNPDTEENEFKEEFFRRIEYANKRFGRGVPGWKTDMGRIYIYLGPPDNVEQRPYINHPVIKGLVWWGYYRYRLGIEFVDKTGDGSYVLNQYQGTHGNLLWVIEQAKFGQIFAENQSKFIDFEVSFDPKKKEIGVTIPVAPLEFKEEEGLLRADFKFDFFIYEKKGGEKARYSQAETVERSEDEILELEELVFSFPYDLKPGEYYFDVVITLQPNINKARKIFKIKLD